MWALPPPIPPRAQVWTPWSTLFDVAILACRIANKSMIRQRQQQTKYAPCAWTVLYASYLYWITGDWKGFLYLLRAILLSLILFFLSVMELEISNTIVHQCYLCWTNHIVFYCGPVDLYLHHWPKISASITDHKYSSFSWTQWFLVPLRQKVSNSIMD